MMPMIQWSAGVIHIIRAIRPVDIDSRLLEHRNSWWTGQVVLTRNRLTLQERMKRTKNWELHDNPARFVPFVLFCSRSEARLAMAVSRAKLRCRPPAGGRSGARASSRPTWTESLKTRHWILRRMRTPHDAVCDSRARSRISPSGWLLLRAGADPL